MSTIDDLLAEGTRLHQAGQLAAAEQLYRQILAADPRHPHALNQFGMLAFQTGDFSAAIERIRLAIDVAGDQAPFHANLGEAYRLAGRPAEAAESFHRALQLNPSMAPVHMLLGIVLHDQEDFAGAAQSLREALRLQPNNQRALGRLGISLERQQMFSEAEACFRRVLEQEDTADVHFRLGGVLHKQELLEEAKSEYQAAIARDPVHAEAHTNLGAILKAQRNYTAAEPHFRIAIAGKPTCATGHINLGSLLMTQGRLDEAAATYRQAVNLEPTSANAHRELGQLLQTQGQLNDARASYEAAIRLDPSNAEGHRKLGYLETIAGRYDEGIACFRRALALQADFALARSNLAVALQSQGLLDEAIAEHRQAIESDPRHAGLHSNLIYTLNFHPAYDAARLFDEHRDWAARHAEALTRVSSPHANVRDPDRRLRIGYVSPHFFDHAVNFFSQPILASHDETHFDVFYYSDVERSDDTTRALQKAANHWREIKGWPDEDVAAQVRADRIDILVDLTGHISGGIRMLVFARKPAPIQVTYIGYQNTTGMTAMDYRLTDAYADPPGQTELHHTERLERLPTSFFCYQPSSYAPAVGPLPAERNGFVTFGSINAFIKVTPQVLETWAQILLQVPTAQLLIRADMSQSLERRLNKTFASFGVTPERLELVNRLPRPRYLELISRLDIALDPFPFNGHTTTCDCLWQGVPVITLSGNTYATRFGGSGLATLGLNELITHSREEYIAAAVNLANDRQRLQAYRGTLRNRMAASPLLDFRSFTQNLEQAYRRMWRAWCGS
jgi:predicted O-linked N-acetylglucosamine transferase (SPINDLY family)